MRAESSLEPRALLINGTVGVGKTSVAEGVGGLLTDAGVPNAVIDLDWLRQSWPAAGGRPLQHRHDGAKSAQRHAAISSLLERFGWSW